MRAQATKQSPARLEQSEPRELWRPALLVSLGTQGPLPDPKVRASAVSMQAMCPSLAPQVPASLTPLEQQSVPGPVRPKRRESNSK